MGTQSLSLSLSLSLSRLTIWRSAIQSDDVIRMLPKVELQGTSKCMTVLLLSKFTGYRDVRFRQVAVEGFAKLMLQGIIADHKVRAPPRADDRCARL